MKKLLNSVGAFFNALIVVWEIFEFLAVPALFIIIGLLNSYPWQYYAISIGGYVALFIAAEVAAYFIFKALDKKYTPILKRKLKKLFDRFTERH